MIEQKPEISQEQIQPEVISVTPKKSPLPVILLIVLGLLVVAGAVYAGIKIGRKQNQPNVISEPTVTPQTTIIPTPDETANWKTLSNKNGFSIKYPPSLKVLGEGIQVDETDAPDVVISSNPGDITSTSPALHINISPKAMTVFKNMTLSQISEANYQANQANQNTFKQIVIPLKSTTLDNKPAYTYTIIANGFSGKWSGWPVNASINNTEKLTVIESENNGDYFIIVYSADDPSISLVLSTFKFTNEDTTVEGRFCGGIAANLPQNQCPEGHTCKLDGDYPDAGGKCVKN